jgi:hypothetical protein
MLLKDRILIDTDFPANKLVKILKPYLFLYYKSMYSFHPQIKKKYFIFFKLSMLRFTKFNPQFGRRKICDKEIVFDDKCINFNYIENQDKDFLLDHLKYDEVDYDLNLNNYFFYNSEEEYDEDETFADNSIDDDSV